MERIRTKKKCNTCKEEKKLSLFYKRKDTPDGYRSDCRDCYRDKSANKWFKDEDFRKRGSERSKKYAVNKLYNLTVEEYDLILSKPCAICHKKSEVLDHDHVSGKILEGLCSACNTGIGNLKEDVHLMHSAIEYILKHNKNSKRFE